MYFFVRRTERPEQQTNRLNYEDTILDLDTREVFRGEKLIELTTKEFDLLHLFMQNPKRVLSRDMIMEKIWGYDYSGESNVLEVYIALLRQKTEEFGHKRLIQTVRGAGYVLRGEINMSLRLRLTLWYSGILAITMLLFGIVLYFFLNYFLYDQIRQDVKREAGQ